MEPPRKDFNFSPSTAAPTPPAISSCSGFSTFKSFGLQVFHSFISFNLLGLLSNHANDSPHLHLLQISLQISGVVEDSDAGSKTSPCTVSASTNEISNFMRANGQAQEHGAEMLESKDAKCQIHVNLFTVNVTKSKTYST